MSVATHPTRIKVLKVVRDYFALHHIKGETCSSKAYLVKENGMLGFCPKAIGTNTMVFRQVCINPAKSRNLGRATCRLSEAEFASHVKALNELLGDEFVVFSRKSAIHVETNVN